MQRAKAVIASASDFGAYQGCKTADSRDALTGGSIQTRLARLLQYLFETPSLSIIGLYLSVALTAENQGAIQMTEDFQDISKYYAASIAGNVLTVGKIIFNEGVYSFAPDSALDRYDLVDPGTDTPREVSLVGEIHPRNALENLIEIEVNSCLYLNEDAASGEIEVRSIHKGIGSSIHIREECPLIQWDEEYRQQNYFHVVDVQHVFTEDRQKAEFTMMLVESLREYELFPPLLNMDVTGVNDRDDYLHNPHLRG